MTMKLLRITFALAGIYLCAGCGHGSPGTQHVTDSSINTNTEPSSAPANSELTGSYQIYDDAAGEWQVKAKWEAPEFSAIEATLRNVFADASPRRARVLLTRSVDNGHIIGITRTPAGKVELGVNMKLDGEWFEANQLDIDSLTTAIEIFRAFYEADARIRTVIEWDEVVE